MIHFVGAGPGAKDLITLRGYRLLTQADVVIYAGSLVNPDLLQDTKEGCEIYNSAYMTLDEVLGVMEVSEEENQSVVRLHTGDPSLYGAIREQMDALREKKIPFDICPGVSSFSGAAAALEIEYTLPEVSQSLIITRAQGKTPVPQRESLTSFAVHQSTMVLFLSSSLAHKVREDLIRGGYDKQTPAAIVYKATWPEERKIVTTLDRLPFVMEEEEITKTALIIIGNILGDFYEKSKLYDPSFTTEYRKGIQK
ncbi:precorrin-4 C(11)-methyltransferase [Anaerostipes sp.]|uniref:precorrin-4 C(11)-methyltransferase n=1 Tax=Anaerostipes sp. TaxID=1872530 RepID=UPI003FED8A34